MSDTQQIYKLARQYRRLARDLVKHPKASEQSNAAAVAFEQLYRLAGKLERQVLETERESKANCYHNRRSKFRR